MSTGTPGKSRGNTLGLIVAGIVGLILILVARQFFAGSSSASPDPVDTGAVNQPDAAAEPDPSCIQVAVSSSSEKAALLRDVAAAYNAERREINGNCAQITINSKASGAAAQALADGWDEAKDGPRPDVWTPASSSWAQLARQFAAAQDTPDVIPTGDLPSVANSPLVIAMPKPMAEALGWPAKPIGWSDLAALAKNPAGWGAKGHPEWGKFKLGKTNPNLSTSGLNATIATYFAATGLSSDLSLKNVQDPKVQSFVKGIEQSVVHYGDTTLTFLGNMATADREGRGLSYVSAVTIEEKSVFDYNMGNPSGDPKTLGQQPKPKVPLAAIYPKDGTLISDSPWITLKADWVTADQQAASKDFLEYVRAPAVQEKFQAAAFRSFEDKPGAVIAPENGMLTAGAPVTLSPPAPPVLAAVSQSWAELRKRARVLLVMDVSGSMGEAVGSEGKSKLELAKQAVNGAVQEFAPTDEVGLMIFSSNAGGEKPYLNLVEVGPASATLSRITDQVNGLIPDGGTALYATTRAAQTQMVEKLSTDKINAVVLLTDGRNEYPADTDLDGLLKQLGGESLDTSVRVFPIGYGENADGETLKRIAEASRAAYYDASDPATIEKVLISVISNF